MTSCFVVAPRREWLVMETIDLFVTRPNPHEGEVPTWRFMGNCKYADRFRCHQLYVILDPLLPRGPL